MSSHTSTPSVHIHLTIPLAILQSLIGLACVITFKHLNGPKIKIEKTGVTIHGAEDVFPNLGRLKPVAGKKPWEGEDQDERGLLIVTYAVKFPATLTPQQRRVLNEVL